MKGIVAAVAVIGSVMLAGCGESPTPRAENQSGEVATVADYKAKLQKRVNSVDGADIDVPKMVAEYERASQEERVRLYKKAEELAR